MADYTHVAAQLHGFTLQVRQMMYELISIDLDKVVSVESLDDVAVQQDETTIAEQVKSVTSENNPLSNRSKVFWKTLFNWLNYVISGTLDANKTIFRMVVSATYNLEAGSIAQKFNAATISTSEAEINSAEATLIGDLSIDDLPVSIRKYAKVVFDNDNRTIMAKIIAKMEIIVYQNNYDEVLFSRFCGQTIPAEYADNLFIYMLGWVHDETNKATKNAESPFILCKAFHDTLVQQTRYYNQALMIPSVTSTPEKDVVIAEVARRDIYIRQLDFIQADFKLKFDAASDFLQTSAEKTDWGVRGIVNIRSFDDYYSTLKRMWSTQKRITDSYNDDEIKRGNRLYAACQGEALKIKIEGKEIPNFFGSGSLQNMANRSDSYAIGWHPRYEEFINLKDGDNSGRT